MLTPDLEIGRRFVDANKPPGRMLLWMRSRNRNAKALMLLGTKSGRDIDKIYHLAADGSVAVSK